LKGRRRIVNGYDRIKGSESKEEIRMHE